MMRVAALGEIKFRFPPPAGDYQQRGSEAAALVRELGDNYARYHQVLEARLFELGGRPRRKAFATISDYLAAWEEVEAIVKAEELLRRCKVFRETGITLDAPTDLGRPLVDRNDRLLSAE